MAHFARRSLSLGALAAALFTAADLSADSGDSDRVGSLWDQYLSAVGTRDELDVLSCYGKDLYKQLANDGTAAGRARLEVHMADLFDLLCRSFEYKIESEEEKGRTFTYTIRFKNKKDHVEHTSKVIFEVEGDKWVITQPPELPDFLKPGKGTIRLIVAVVLAVGVIAFFLKKALG